MATGIDETSRRGSVHPALRAVRTKRNSADAVAAICLTLGCTGLATAQMAPTISPGGEAGGSRSITFVPGIRSTLLVSDSLATTSGSGGSGYSLEVTPYLNASIASARTQGSISYSMRNFLAHTSDSTDTFMRHDLRANINSLLISDWFGIQSSAAIYNTNASPLGGLSSDPGASLNNNAALRTFSVSPYIQGRAGSFATYRALYRFDQTSTSGNVSSAALAKGSHSVSLNVNGGPQFNPWGWGFNTSGSRREFDNNVSLSSASTSASIYYTPSAELRLGASMNYLYIERLTNSSGESNGWGPGMSIDWTPSRRTTLRGTIVKQYYGTSESLRLAHRTNRFAFGLDYSRSILQSNNAALLTFNPGSVFSGGGFSPDLNPLFTQLNNAGLLSRNDVVLGTGVINDALVRNKTLTASVGYVMPRWSATATAFRSTRETVISSEVFGISNALSPASFGVFTNKGITLAGSLTLDARSSLGISASVRDTESSDQTAKARLNLLQGTFSSRIDNRSVATLGVRRTVQSGSGPGAISRDENAIFGTIDIRLR